MQFLADFMMILMLNLNYLVEKFIMILIIHQKIFLLDFYLLTKAVEKNYKIKTFNVFFKKGYMEKLKAGEQLLGKLSYHLKV